jgi:2-C-methyl-D-erythritol 2,4-cyclodiphosphate synthase
MRIGIGYDVHKLKEGRELIIGGIKIQYHKGLEGHSDADVLIHSIIDAILGALGKGDIGVMFPDSESKYKNIDSKLLLTEVYRLMKKSKYKIANLDSIIIAEKPKMSMYTLEMKSVISEILDTTEDNINIKATTTEKLGFTGRGQGIAAQSVVLLDKE